MDATDPQHRRLVRRDREMVPTLLVQAMGVMCLCALLIVAYARLTDRPLEAMPALGDEVPVAAERLVVLTADPQTGAAQVHGADGTLIADLDPTEGGFVAGVHRALAFERNRQGVDPSAPIRLVRYETGQLSLRDPETGWRAELIGFGATNAAAFAALID